MSTIHAGKCLKVRCETVPVHALLAIRACYAASTSPCYLGAGAGLEVGMQCELTFCL